MAKNFPSFIQTCFRIITLILMMFSVADFSERYFDFVCAGDFSEAGQQGCDCGDMDKISVREASAGLTISLCQLRRGGFPLTGSQRLLLPALPTGAKAIPIRPGLQRMFRFRNRIAALRI